MTKLREPDSIHEAVRQAMVFLGDKVIAAEFECSEQLVQAWSDKDDDREITLVRAAKVDAMLVQRGFEPVFAPLLARQAAAAAPNATAAAVPPPLAAVLSVAGTIGGALSTMANAARDGMVSTGEIHGCLKATEALQVETANCRRSLFAALRRSATAKRGR
ncbi:MAG: hypothetical protein IKE60_34420 [Reyranella sp.]|uniref:hypothetical protein n=1 Tax=Reyranella sp. TaxID=1929291 RepID=UPI0025DD84D8|nr:hypothetical protein [Reyranella sp.]MBR2819816.1 hypothetical protein [Reyranella sp.]